MPGCILLTSCWPSQIACIVTTVYVTCTQNALHIHEHLCRVLIPPCKNNLNLPIRLSFFFCPVLGCLFFLFIKLSCSLPCCVAFFIVCLYVSQFCNPAINQTTLTQSIDCFLFILKHFWPIGKLIWKGENMIHWRVKTGLKDDFIM